MAYHGHQGGLWTLWQFAQGGFIQFLFEDTDESGVMKFAVEHVAECLREAAADCEGPGLVLVGKETETITDLPGLVDFLKRQAGEKNTWFENVTTATRRAFLWRLKTGARQVARLISADGKFDYQAQLNVVDIHTLTERARAFVVGGVLRTIVLDELNKYAPRERGGPIKDMLLDVAERGRSLGIVLMGAEQTASQVEERVVGNAALRVVGRLEAAESEQPVYGWLTGTMHHAAPLDAATARDDDG